MTDAAPLPPLRERVAAPREVAHPDGIDGVAWRPATLEDAPAITALLEAMSRTDHPEWSESLDEIVDELSHSWVDLPADSVVAHDPDGALVAWGLVIEMPEPETLFRIIVPGGVHPAWRGRGLGWRLLAWQRARAEERLSRSDSILPAWVLSYAPDRAPGHGRLLERAGFEPARYFTSLVAALEGAGLERELPAGVRVEPMSDARAEAVRLAKNASFADHWGSQPSTIEAWSSMLALPTARPELGRLAIVGEEVVGFVLTEINEDDWERQGFTGCYIGLVGTVRSWRGRGLATALLAEVMRAAREAGLERVVLDVDTENPTGALGVYTRLGFTATSRDVSYRIAY